MPKPPDLTDDQRAVLSLLLRRGKSYQQIASALSLGEQEVRSRAQQALSALAPEQAASCESDQIAEVCDLLLDQLPPAERLIAYDRIEGSPRASALLAALQPLLQQAPLAPPQQPAAATPASAPASAPKAPAQEPPLAHSSPPPRASQPARAAGPAASEPAAGETPTTSAPAGGASRSSEAQSGASHQATAAVSLGSRRALAALRKRSGPQPAKEQSRFEQAPAAPKPSERPGEAGERMPRRGSRRGGALLLAGLAGALVLALYIAGVFGAAEGNSSPAADGSGNAAAQAATTTTHSAAEAVQEARIQLHSPGSATRAAGEAIIANAQGKRELALEARQLPPPGSDFYVVWLYNSERQFEAVGSAQVGSDGRLPASVIELPADAHEFHDLILTRESTKRPTHPGEIVLSGSYSLH